MIPFSGFKKKSKSKKKPKTETLIERPQKAYYKSQSDYQNVHDSIVNRDLKKKYEILKTMSSVRGTTEEIINEVLYSGLNEDMIFNIIEVLNTIKKNNHLSIIDDYEMNLLLLIWNKVKNDEDLKFNFFLNLVDCYDRGNVVCASGRCVRLMDTFILHDKYPELSQPQLTYDIIKTDILNKGSVIFKNASQQKGKEFMEKYNKGINDEDIEIFENNIKNEIIEYAKKFNLNENEMKKIKNEINCIF